MRILITNDDGVHAQGLAVLREIASTLSNDIWVVAPETNQSGVSHSLTLHDPLRVRKYAEKCFAVTGTPTDCVLMAVLELMKNQGPDLVLSGVNRGQNTADDVTYSGTVAGAIEGMLLGIPSIALSQARIPSTGEKSNMFCWDCARGYGSKVVRRLVEAGWPKDIVLNVNFPDCSVDALNGISVTRQGQRNPNLTLKYEQRKDMRDDPYYWLYYRRNIFEPEEGTDLAALAANEISITPLHLDFTHEETCAKLSKKFNERTTV